MDLTATRDTFEKKETKHVYNTYMTNLLLIRVGHSVLFRSVRYVLLRSKRRTLRSFPFFLKFLATYQTPKERYVLFRSFLKNGKEREKRNVLLQRTEKNGKNVTFFCKERKRTGERFVLLQKERENVTFFFRALRSLSK